MPRLYHLSHPVISRRDGRIMRMLCRECLSCASISATFRLSGSIIVGLSDLAKETASIVIVCPVCIPPLNENTFRWCFRWRGNRGACRRLGALGRTLSITQNKRTRQEYARASRETTISCPGPRYFLSTSNIHTTFLSPETRPSKCLQSRPQRSKRISNLKL